MNTPRDDAVADGRAARRKVTPVPHDAFRPEARAPPPYATSSGARGRPSVVLADVDFAGRVAHDARMIVVVGAVRVKPEAREHAIRAALEMAEATRREAGCRAYRFSADLADPELFYIHEEWDSADALHAHFATPHMATFQQALPAVLASPPVLTRFEVSSAGPLA